MKAYIQRYAILLLSLLVLFTSGIFIGRLTAPNRTASAPPPATDPQAATPASWISSASGNLARDLQLNDAQKTRVSQHLQPVAAAIFEDRERTLFQMHLRLLELHDTLAKDPSLTPAQIKRLASSRAELRERIIRTFPHKVRDNPALANSP
jgi:hypothetical protein